MLFDVLFVDTVLVLPMNARIATPLHLDNLESESPQYTQPHSHKVSSKVSAMLTEALSIQPGELKFPFELRKQISCSVQLVNTTESYVAFKVKTTSPKKYCVRPNTGVVSPGATCDITVTMQAQRDAPPDMQCKDKFLVQSVILADDADHKEVSQDAFNKAPGKEVFETKLRVLYVSPPQPPSPVPESSEEGISPRPSLTLDNGFDIGSDGSWKAQLAEAQSSVARLTDEKETALLRSQQLQEELTAIVARSGGKGNISPHASPGFSFLFVLIVGLLGILVGYFLRS